MKQYLYVLGVSFCLFSVKIYAQERDGYVLTVDEMFSLADQNSKSIQLHETAIEQASQGVKVAKTAQLPAIDLSLSASFLGDGWMADRDFSNGMNASMPHFGNNFSLEASQVVYAGGAIQGSIEKARLEEKLAYLAKDQHTQDMRFLLIGYYLELYKLNNQRAVYLKNIEQTKVLIDQVRIRQREGVALANDVTRYELQLKTLELALTQVDNSRTIYNHELVTVLGLPAHTFIQPDTTLLNRVIPLSTEQSWQEAAVESLPLLKQADLQIQLNRKQEKITRAEWLPKVAIVAADHLDGPITIEVPPINKNFNYWYVGIGLKYNLASLYTTSKKQRLNKITTRRSQENYSLALENTELAVQAAHVRLAEAFVQLDTQEKSLQLATQNYDVINNRYMNDLALITDMLDASNSKLSAELQLVNTRINILFNYYKLKKVSGKI